jgi:hypothetical protein
MIGFAPRPDTLVLPTCSIDIASPSRTAFISFAIRVKSAGHRRSPISSSASRKDGLAVRTGLPERWLHQHPCDRVSCGGEINQWPSRRRQTTVSGRTSVVRAPIEVWRIPSMLAWTMYRRRRGRCREFIRQTDKDNLDTEVVLSDDKSVLLKELLPYHDWFQKR